MNLRSASITQLVSNDCWPEKLDREFLLQFSGWVTNRLYLLYHDLVVTFNYHQNILYLQKCTTYRKREQQLFLIKKQAFDKVEASYSMYADFLLDFFLSYISLPFPP